MLRIAHISDLHIRDQLMDNDDKSLLQEMATFLLKKIGVEVTAGGHDPAKLDALKNRLVGLKPDVIVVTGDLTNFGDITSFKTAVEYLRDLQRKTGARKVLCVPGNHDCLVERLAAARQEGGRVSRLMLRIVAWTNLEVARMNEGAKRQFRATKWSSARVAKLFENYRAHVVANEFGVCDPAQPIEIDAAWGKVVFFLFNSVNEPGLMANKGRIGIDQFNRLNALAQDVQRWAQLNKAVRVALLHHHPLSAPQANDGAVERAYDWMDDGPRLLSALNKRRFHFVLHGHQHEPFTCAINYGQADAPPIHVVGAGSAAQGSMQQLKNSFNLIDLVSPFEAVFGRYEMDGTGFSDKPVYECSFPVRSITEVRVSPHDSADTVEDWAMRELVRSGGQLFRELGDAYKYEALEFDITITKDHLYRGRYRRRGVLLDKDVTEGPIFVITGSPEMKLAAMKLKGIDNLTKDSALNCKSINDSPNRKIICVQPRIAPSVRTIIDVTLEFEWQASETEPNNFDAITLMGFRHPVDQVTYRARTEWCPTQVQLRSIGLSTEELSAKVSSRTAPGLVGFWEHAFTINKPAALAYMIRFPA